MSVTTVEGTALQAVLPSCYLIWTPTTADQFVMLAAHTASTSSPRYSAPLGVSAVNATETSRSVVMPLAGSVTAIYTKSDTTYTGTQARTFDFMVNAGAATNISCALNSTNTTACNDTASSGSDDTDFAAGDLLSLRDVNTAGGDAEPADNIGFGIRFTPTTAGEFPLIAAVSSGFVAAGNRFAVLNGGTAASQSAETTVDCLMPAFTSKRVYGHIVTGPSVGYEFFLRDDGASVTSTCSIAAAGTSCGPVTANVSVAANKGRGP